MKIMNRTLYSALLLLQVLCINLSLTAGNSIATAIALDKNQKIVVGGFADNSTNSTTDFALARYNPDGTLDTTFNPTLFQPGQVTLDIQNSNDAITGIAIDSSNRIIAVGTSAIGINGFNNEFAVARFNPDGTLDITFNANGALGLTPGIALIRVGNLSDNASGVAIDQKGNIVIAGTTDNGRNTDVAVVRLTPEGVLDTTFNPQGNQPGIATYDINGGNDTGNAVAIDSSNRIIIAGSALSGPNNSISSSLLTTDFLVMRINEDATLDTTFNKFSLNPGFAFEQVGSNTNSAAFALAIDQDQNIVLGGSASNGLTTTFALMKFTQDGLLDGTFNPFGNGNVSPGIVVTNVAQLTLAPTPTNAGAIPGSNSILGIAIDAHNQIVATGFSKTSLNRVFATARYSSDGSLDGTFNPNGIAPGIVITDLAQLQPTGDLAVNDNNANALVIDAQNNYIVTGFFRSSGQNNFTTIEYLPSGAFNTAFGPTQTTPGIVITPFGVQATILGNGVPYTIGGTTEGISPTFLEGLRYPLTTELPTIVSKGPIITNDYRPTLGGTASPNSIITLYVNDIPLTDTLAAINGGWSVTLPPLLDGTYQLFAVATDPLTGLTLSSVPTTLTILTRAPEPPRIEQPGINEIITASRVLIQGRSEPETRVSVFLGDRVIGQALTNKFGIWQLTTEPLKDGYYPLFAIAVDKVGNGSAPSELIPFTVDTGTARAPSIAAPLSRAIIKTKTIEVMGDARPVSLVNLFLDNKLIKQIRASKEGRWSFTLAGLSDGAHQIFASTITEPKLSSPTVSFTIDTKPSRRRVPPTTSVISKGLINGVAEPNGIIKLMLDGKPFGTTIANAQGAWSFTPPRDQKIGPGMHALRIAIADENGDITSFVDRTIQGS